MQFLLHTNNFSFLLLISFGIGFKALVQAKSLLSKCVFARGDSVTFAAPNPEGCGIGCGPEGNTNWPTLTFKLQILQ